MSFSIVEMTTPLAKRVEVTTDTLTVDLSDSRTIAVPLLWYPRLFNATVEERKSWRFIGGQPSRGSQGSLKTWLDNRPPHKRNSKRNWG
jgi:hypothetical protein